MSSSQLLIYVPKRITEFFSQSSPSSPQNSVSQTVFFPFPLYLGVGSSERGHYGKLHQAPKSAKRNCLGLFQIKRKRRDQNEKKRPKENRKNNTPQATKSLQSTNSS